MEDRTESIVTYADQGDWMCDPCGTALCSGKAITISLAIVATRVRCGSIVSQGKPSRAVPLIEKLYKGLT